MIADEYFLLKRYTSINIFCSQLKYPVGREILVLIKIISINIHDPIFFFASVSTQALFFQMNPRSRMFHRTGATTEKAPFLGPIRWQHLWERT